MHKYQIHAKIHYRISMGISGRYVKFIDISDNMRKDFHYKINRLGVIYHCLGRANKNILPDALT